MDDLEINYSETTIAKVLRKHGILPAPDRKDDLTWKKFIKAHLEVMVAFDFFTKEIWTKNGLVTYYILVFIHLGSRRLFIQNITANWTTQ